MVHTLFRKRVNFLIQRLTKNRYHLTCCVTLSHMFTLRIPFVVERVESWFYKYLRKGQLSLCVVYINRQCSHGTHSFRRRHERDSCHCFSVYRLDLVHIQKVSIFRKHHCCAGSITYCVSLHEKCDTTMHSLFRLAPQCRLVQTNAMQLYVAD